MARASHARRWTRLAASVLCVVLAVVILDRGTTGSATLMPAEPEGWIEPGRAVTLPAELTFSNPQGQVGVLFADGAVDTANHPFFAPTGTNGRACVTCHRDAAHVPDDWRRRAAAAGVVSFWPGTGARHCEWGGAVLLAVENAPPGRRAWYGMFPQLGAPIGFFCSGAIFLLLSEFLTDEQFFAFGWRIPFLASAVLVDVGLYVRLTITKTPAFREAIERSERVEVPMFVVFRQYPRELVLGTVAALATSMLFYLSTVFALSWATTMLGYSRQQFLLIQLFAAHRDTR